MSKKIFITGTSTGFGKLTAITLSNAGHTVIAGMRGVNGNILYLAISFSFFFTGAGIYSIDHIYKRKK